MTRAWRLLALVPFFTSFASEMRQGEESQHPLSPLSAEAFFNHNEKSTFREPYRGLLRTGDDFEEILLSRIKKAKERVWVAVHEFRVPRLAELLHQKRQEGVDVRVILENSYSASFPFRSESDLEELPEIEASRNKDYFYFIDENHDGRISDSELKNRDVPTYLRERAIPLRDDTSDGSKGTGLMHHKFAVIDKTHVIVTSANFTWSDFYGDFLNTESRGNANHLVVIESSALNQKFEEEFLQMWDSKKFGVKKFFRGKQSFPVQNSQEIWLQFAPTGSKVPWEKSALGSIVAQIGEAEKSVDIAQFVFSEQKIADALDEWTEDEDHDLRTLVDPQFAYQDYSELLDLFGLQMFNRFCKYEENNAPWNDPLTENIGSPALLKGDKFHHKFAVIDGKWTLFGSLNWSASGNHENDETLVALQDPTIAAQFTEEFERALKGAKLGIPSWLPKKIHEKEENCSSRGYIAPLTSLPLRFKSTLVK